MTNNNVLLYQAMLIFRKALLPFIEKQLNEAFGKGWWKAGVQPALGEDAVVALEKQFERRYSKKLSAVKRPGSEVYEMLDIGHFLPIFQKNWKRCFVNTFEEQSTTEVWLREIVEVRNAVAHPENQPLSGPDTFRALDTMTRIVRIIDPSLADQIQQILQNADPKSQTDHSDNTIELDINDGLFDYEKGLKKLRSVILNKEGKSSDVHLKLEIHRRQLVNSLYEKKLTPGIQNNELEVRINFILNELERLANLYCKAPFTNLCVTPKPANPIQDTKITIRELEMTIKELEKKLYERQYKRLAQQKTGEVIQKLERDIDKIEEQLSKNKNELARLLKTVTPSVFFSVNRSFEPDGITSLAEEQSVHVFIDIINCCGPQVKDNFLLN